LYEELTKEAQKQKPGESGLLALDWNNGNRTILVDSRLTGLLIGMTLHTSQAEVYRALIEGPAFGARMIIEHLEKNGIPIREVVCCGGIAEKNPLFMQIYADVFGKTMMISRSSQSCALGSAVAAATVAKIYPDITATQESMTGVKAKKYVPDKNRHEVYNRLFKLYRSLHDAFGRPGYQENMGYVMKELLRIKEETRAKK
jgi:L-ribulokinase